MMYATEWAILRYTGVSSLGSDLRPRASRHAGAFLKAIHGQILARSR